ncbi:MAG: type I DNA topoisomerase [Planctomycetia bacterium]
MPPTAAKKTAARAEAERHLVIVESPAKAKTIKKFLGEEYQVEACKGHVRDLPERGDTIPEPFASLPDKRLAVDIDRDFEPCYVVSADRRDSVATLRRLLKDADVLWLATDEDREGESISWHLLEVLKPKVPVKRLVFHEVTREAILHALAEPRALDMNLVQAQEARRILDRLMGYRLSPVLWRKVGRPLSAGRVQTVALALLVDRELERRAFRKASYWDLLARLAPGGDATQAFEARLVEVAGKRVAQGGDFEPTTGQLARDAHLLDEAQARELARRLGEGPATVLGLETKPWVRRPFAPFTTSTLQQEAGRKLGMTSRNTMSAAQALYQGGAITYMRTDSTTLSKQALDAARDLIRTQYGAEWLTPEPRQYATKVKNAQEAHEAIRPAGTTFRDVRSVAAEFGPEAGRLYEMIWQRTVASQMRDAHGDDLRVDIGLGAVTGGTPEALVRANGRTTTFAGWMRAYQEGDDEPEAGREGGREARGGSRLPPLAKGQSLQVLALDASGHETQPPARFTEASLIKELDRRGIGRPSTWATIVGQLRSPTSEYVLMRGNAMVPTWTGIVVVRMLRKHFRELLDYDFTATMEDGLDTVARGEDSRVAYLRRFWDGFSKQLEASKAGISPRHDCAFPLGTGSAGPIEVRVGKFGLFMSDDARKCSLPVTMAPDELTVARAEELLAQAARGPDSLGVDPATGKKVYLLMGRNGAYLRLGEAPPAPPKGSKKKVAIDPALKPKTSSLLPGMNPAQVDLATALKLLSLPRDLGENPEHPEKAHVMARLGRFGPYVTCGTESRSLPKGVNLLEVDLATALAALKAPRMGRGQREAKPPLRELGKHPQSAKPIVMRDGKYGVYITDGVVNANVPPGLPPEAITLEQAVELLAERERRMAEGGGRRGKGRGRRAPAKGSTTAPAGAAASGSDGDAGDAAVRAAKAPGQEAAARKGKRATQPKAAPTAGDAGARNPRRGAKAPEPSRGASDGAKERPSKPSAVRPRRGGKPPAGDTPA